VPKLSTAEPLFKVNFLTLPSDLILGVLYAFLGEEADICRAFVVMSHEKLMK
jgi:hypothetical protein